MPMPPTTAPRRRATLLVVALVAWVLGTALGTTTEGATARATPFLQLEQARAGYVPALDGSTPIFILVLGSDARPGEEIAGQRADSIHVVAINPAKHRATIVGFPRDSWVEIPGYGTNKINAAMPAGGPELVVKTVESLLGVRMDYWALTWFDGFRAMIDDIGGLTVDVPFDVHDSYSRADLSAGLQTLDGRDALAFARARHALPNEFGNSTARSNRSAAIGTAPASRSTASMRSRPGRAATSGATDGLATAASVAPAGAGPGEPAHSPSASTGFSMTRGRAASSSSATRMPTTIRRSINGRTAPT